MEINDEPLAFFLTWTVYGTFLQGDIRWWRKKRQGSTPPQPALEQWHRDRLKHEVVLLDENHRAIVNSQIAKHCQHRSWHLWVANARTNHVHVVVTAKNYSGNRVRDQLKANCTGALRKNAPIFVDRPIWTTGGDWQCLNDDDSLQEAIEYADEGQDQKRFEH